jgi:hypothetical protein
MHDNDTKAVSIPKKHYLVLMMISEAPDSFELIDWIPEQQLLDHQHQSSWNTFHALVVCLCEHHAARLCGPKVY